MDKDYSLECLTPGMDGLGRACIVYSRKRGCLPLSRKKPEHFDPEICGTSDPIDSSIKEYDPQLHMTVENSPEGIWEFFLFSNMWQFLPLWWHANYSKVTFITDGDKLLKIAHINRKIQQEFKAKGYIDSLVSSEHESEDRGFILGTYGLTNEIIKEALRLCGDQSLLPSVEMDGTDALITYTYWSEWGGLIREKIKVTNTDGTPKFKEIAETESLIPYNCGIKH